MVGLGAAAASGIDGLIQQAWTLALRLSAAFGSILLPSKIKHRNEAWI